MRHALDYRLQLRSYFLSATECPQHMKEPEVAREPWQKGLDLLPDIKSTHSLGKPVEEACSAKLQRKLASTMPPRPIVQLGFGDALGHLVRLFEDGIELIDVLNYTNSQCLQVNGHTRHIFTPNRGRLLFRVSKRRNRNHLYTCVPYYRHSCSTRWRFWDR